MPLYIYTDGIPNVNNDPSDDQPDMQVNTNSIDGIIGEDHFSFNNINGGLHQKCRLVDQSGIPSGVAGGMGTIYSKLEATSASTKESNLFLTPDATGNQYQLSRTISTAFTNFGTYLAYGTPPGGKTQKGGWTFLPGGLLLQYGIYGVLTATTETIEYPVLFSTAVFVVQCTVSGTLSRVVNVIPSSVSALNNFQVSINNTSGGNNIFWTAIGV